MRRQHSVETGLGAHLDAITRLENIDAIVPLEVSFVGKFDSHASEFGFHMFSNKFKEPFGRFSFGRTRSKVVHLTAHNNFFFIDQTGVYRLVQQASKPGGDSYLWFRVHGSKTGHGATH